MTIWQHLFPPFDQWWPNVIGSVVWAPLVGIHHVIVRKHQKRLNLMLERLHRHHGITVKEQV